MLRVAAPMHLAPSRRAHADRQPLPPALRNPGYPRTRRTSDQAWLLRPGGPAARRPRSHQPVRTRRTPRDSRAAQIQPHPPRPAQATQRIETDHLGGMNPHCRAHPVGSARSTGDHGATAGGSSPDHAGLRQCQGNGGQAVATVRADDEELRFRLQSSCRAPQRLTSSRTATMSSAPSATNTGSEVVRRPARVRAGTIRSSPVSTPRAVEVENLGKPVVDRLVAGHGNEHADRAARIHRTGHSVRAYSAAESN